MHIRNQEGKRKTIIFNINFTQPILVFLLNMNKKVVMKTIKPPQKWQNISKIQNSHYDPMISQIWEMAENCKPTLKTFVMNNCGLLFQSSIKGTILHIKVKRTVKFD